MKHLLATALFSLAATSPISPEVPALGERGIDLYGYGENVAIDAPGVPYQPAFKGFPSAGRGIRQINFLAAFAVNKLFPGQVPPGVNPTHCVPKDGQPPVILIPGTVETVYTNWAYMGPKLADEGLCVYSFAHAPLTFLNDGTVLKDTAFLGNITTSAYALSAFVDEVLELTGASQVDFVGHSQGAGALPFYYLKNIMKGNKVRKNVGLAPSLGTEFHGINKLLNLLVGHHGLNQISDVFSVAADAASLIQQLVDSEWMKELHAGGLAVDGVEYINLSTRHDEILVPYQNCNFEQEGKNIKNIVLQDICLLDFSDHLGICYSSNVLQIVKNQLFDTDKPVFCLPQAPIIN